MSSTANHSRQQTTLLQKQDVIVQLGHVQLVGWTVCILSRASSGFSTSNIFTAGIFTLRLLNVFNACAQDYMSRNSHRLECQGSDSSLVLPSCCSWPVTGRQGQIWSGLGTWSEMSYSAYLERRPTHVITALCQVLRGLPLAKLAAKSPLGLPPDEAACKLSSSSWLSKCRPCVSTIYAYTYIYSYIYI